LSGSPREPDRVRATFSRNPRYGVVKNALVVPAAAIDAAGVQKILQDFLLVQVADD
jgi:hypothetical protein